MAARFAVLFSLSLASVAAAEEVLGSFSDPLLLTHPGGVDAASYSHPDLNAAGLFPHDQVHDSWHSRGEKRALGAAWTGASKLAAAGTSGVGGMQMTVVSEDQIVIFDKSENNPLQVQGHPAWGAVYTISNQALRPLNLRTNSFCAGGGWLSNGTLVSVGGNPREGSREPAAAGNGLQAVRLFTPCTNNKCDVIENPSRLHLTSARWYPSTVRLQDGSLLIAGGMLAGGFNNAPATDNPTMEFFPPKGNGLQFYSKFLHDALNTNLFPIMFLLSNSGQVFMAANKLAMLYDWKNNVEYRLPDFPNGIRTNYPSTTASALLPLTVANKWTPTVLLCGGSAANVEGNPSQLSSQTPASNQCAYMTLNPSGIKRGWVVEDHLPENRVMGDAVLTPDGKVFIVNGAQTGIAGYGNVPNEIGSSNAGNPAFRPCLYDPLAPAGKRISTNFPSSSTERLYHSAASLLADGRIIIMGSNPNDDVSNTKYQTRYNVEMFSPPYMSLARPTFSGSPANILFGKNYNLAIQVPSGTKTVQAVIMDFGFATHGFHMNSRYVELVSSVSGGTLTVTGPKNANYYPPGVAFLFVVADGVPSKGVRLIVGPGSGPPVSAAAEANLLAKTKNQQS